MPVQDLPVVLPLPKLLVLASRFPYPLEKGDKLRLYHQIKQLATVFEVHLVALVEDDLEVGHTAQLQPYCTSIHTFALSTLSCIWHAGASILSDKPIQVAYYTARHIQRGIQEVYDRVSPDIVYCQLARMAEYVQADGIPKVIDYMDAFSVGMERRAAVVPWYQASIYRAESRRMRQYERSIASRFIGHTIISEQDRAALEWPELTVVSNGIDIDYYQPQHDYQPRYDIGFVGNMGYLPNVAAAEYLALEINDSHRYSILIGGARPDPRVKQLTSDHVTITGWVEDIRAAYLAAKVCVAPLYNGTGQQNKILEAMAMGVPVITTSTVNAAIGAVPHQEIMIADSAAQFRAIIDTLLRDEALRSQLAAAARQMVVQRYSWTSQTAPLINLLTASL